MPNAGEWQMRYLGTVDYTEIQIHYFLEWFKRCVIIDCFIPESKCIMHVENHWDRHEWKSHDFKFLVNVWLQIDVNKHVTY